MHFRVFDTKYIVFTYCQGDDPPRVGTGVFSHKLLAVKFKNTDLAILTYYVFSFVAVRNAMAATTFSGPGTLYYLAKIV